MFLRTPDDVGVTGYGAEALCVNDWTGMRYKLLGVDDCAGARLGVHGELLTVEDWTCILLHGIMHALIVSFTIWGSSVKK